MACSKPVLPEKYHPNKGFAFPSRSFGKSTRSFRPEWCIAFPWLHYNTEKDAAFCYLCMVTEFEGKFLSSTRRDRHSLPEDTPTGRRQPQLSVNTREVIVTNRL